MHFIAVINPASYAVDAMCWSLIGQSHFGITRDPLILVISLCAAIWFGVYRFRRIEA